MAYFVRIAKNLRFRYDSRTKRGKMAKSEVLARLKNELTEVREAISRIQRGEFEVKRGDRSFQFAGLRDLRRQERRLIRAIQRCERGGAFRQGVPRERYRGYR